MLLKTLGTSKPRTVKNSVDIKGKGADQELRRTFGNHRSRLVVTAIVAMVAIVALTATAVVTHRGDLAAANEPQAKGSPASLRIDLIHCSKGEPEKLPPDALAGAPEAALDQVPSIFGHVAAYVDREARTPEGAYASSA
jgi:hypothetical protein